MSKKNIHAVALGRKGGLARAKVPGEMSRIGRLGGQPRKYRLTADGRLQKWTGAVWVLLPDPLDRNAREARRRLRAQGRIS